MIGIMHGTCNVQVLTLYAPISQNGQTHSNNSSANCRWIAWVVWPFCEIGACRFLSSVLQIWNEINRSSCLEVFCKKVVLWNFANFTGKYLCQSLFFNKVVGSSKLGFKYLTQSMDWDLYDRVLRHERVNIIMKKSTNGSPIM